MIGMVVVDALSFGLAAAALIASWRWHLAGAREAAETRRIAESTARAQGRLATATPWDLARRSDMVLFTNRTGEAASAVELSLDSPWYFWDERASDTYRNAQTAVVEHPQIHAGSSVAHTITTDAESALNTSVHVRWTDGAGERHEWTFPALWAVMADQ